MPRPKQPSIPATTTDEKLDRLTAAVEQLTRELDEARDVAQELQAVRHELRVLRDVADEIRENLEWAVRNTDRFREPPYVVHMTSMPLDPLSEDFRVNRVTAKELPAELQSEPIPPTKNVQGELWES